VVMHFREVQLSYEGCSLTCPTDAEACDRNAGKVSGQPAMSGPVSPVWTVRSLLATRSRAQLRIHTSVSG